MKKHALLAPSSAERWLTCTPSAVLEKEIADKSSDFADEGTLAHDIGEVLIKHKLGLYNDKILKSNMKVFEKDKHYSVSLLDYADQYATYCIERLNEARKHCSAAAYYIEADLDMSEYVPEAHGTGDFGIITTGYMEVIDLKYGKGVKVSVVENKQAMLYALGALSQWEMIYDIKKVSMTIYQPRMDNISSWEMTAHDLKLWAEKVLRPTAEKAFKGEGEFKVGKHCLFCKVKPQCRALANHNQELAAYDFREPVLLSDDEIADILKRADMFSKWITSVENYSLDQAVNHGKQWPGFKLVEGRGKRIYTDEENIAKELRKLGWSDEQIYTKDLLGITAMEKLIGKKVFTLALSGYIAKPPGKPTLVPASDSRPEYHGTGSAAIDFADDFIDE